MQTCLMILSEAASKVELTSHPASMQHEFVGTLNFAETSAAARSSSPETE